MPTRPLLIVLLFAAVATATGGEQTDATDGDAAQAAQAEGTEQTTKEAGPFSLRSKIQAKRARLRDVPGRTGILAEERLYSVFDEELIIRDFFQDRRGGFFVDVGCAWPIKASNTYYLEKHLGWTGIGIDALSEFAPAWQRERPSSRFFSFLVTDHTAAEETFFRSENVGLSSAHRERADGTHFGGELEVEEIRIPSTTLDALLAREKVQKIDLLSLDIEGHELEALHGLDLARFAPELVVAEGQRVGVTDYLLQNGYEVIERYRPFDDVNLYYRRRAPEVETE